MTERACRRARARSARPPTRTTRAASASDSALNSSFHATSSSSRTRAGAAAGAPRDNVHRSAARTSGHWPPAAPLTSRATVSPGAALQHEKKPPKNERDELFEHGSTAQRYAEADLVREGTYNTAEVCQNQIEMHPAVAEYDAVRERDRKSVV